MRLAGRKTWNMRHRPRELRQVPCRRAQRVLEVKGHLCSKKRGPIEIVEAGTATGLDDPGLDEILEVLRGHAKNRARLFQLELVCSHLSHPPFNYRLHFRRYWKSVQRCIQERTRSFEVNWRPTLRDWANRAHESWSGPPLRVHVVRDDRIALWAEERRPRWAAPDPTPDGCSNRSSIVVSCPRDEAPLLLRPCGQLVVRPSRDSSRLPSHATLPRSRRTLRCFRTARRVCANLLRIARLVNVSQRPDGDACEPMRLFFTISIATVSSKFSLVARGNSRGLRKSLEWQDRGF